METPEVSITIPPTFYLFPFLSVLKIWKTFCLYYSNQALEQTDLGVIMPVLSGKSLDFMNHVTIFYTSGEVEIKFT